MTQQEARIFVLEKTLENVLELFDEDYSLVYYDEDSPNGLDHNGIDVVDEAYRVLYEGDEGDE